MCVYSCCVTKYHNNITIETIERRRERDKERNMYIERGREIQR